MKSRFLAGLIAGLAVTWIGYLFFIWAGLPFLPALFSDLLFSLIPGDIQAEGIALLGYLAKPLTLFLFMLAQTLLLALSSTSRISTPSWIVHAFLVVAPMHFVLSLISTSPAEPIIPTALSVIGLIAIYAVIFALIAPKISPPIADKLSEEDVVDTAIEQQLYKRRQFIGALGAAAGTVLLWPVVASDLTRSAAIPEYIEDPIVLPEQAFDGIPGLPPALTPTRDFYYVSKNLLPHQGRAQEPLIVEGLVDNPIELTLESLLEMDSIEAFVTLMCVDYEPHNSITNDLISNGLWKGVRLKTLLDMAGGPQPGYWLEMHATDGFSTAIPIEYAYDVPETMIAYQLNGRSLNGRHGFPARLIAPGIYGYKNIKHINKINVTDREFYGYWEGRGWANEAPIRLMSRTTTPYQGEHINILEERWIAGIAYSGRFGISAVEVSFDEGENWSRADLEPALSQFSWARWAYKWLPNHLGEQTLLVRTTDGNGQIQDSRIRPAFRSGASGYHRVRVEIVEG